MRLEVRWATVEWAAVQIGTPLDVHEVTGLSTEELAAAAAEFPEKADIDAVVSSQGKGASGPAAAVVVVVEHVLGDTASLIGIGVALRSLIRKIRNRFGHDPVMEDRDTLGAIASAEPGLSLTGYRYARTAIVTGAEGMGTDRRDIYASVFAGDDQQGAAIVVFMSPTGLCLGSVRVPAQCFLEQDRWRDRTSEEIAQWWSQ